MPRRECHRLIGNRPLHPPARAGLRVRIDLRDLHVFFQTGIKFRPTLQAQHDNAEAKGQHHRVELFNRLLSDLKEGEAS